MGLVVDFQIAHVGTSSLRFASLATLEAPSRYYKLLSNSKAEL